MVLLQMRGAVLTLAVVASCWTLAATTPTVGLGLGGLGLGIKPLIGLKVRPSVCIYLVVLYRVRARLVVSCLRVSIYPIFP
ncbi:hypothetical protein E2C01_099569 [Portunus trituberculatus]|uniref:Uncharacterized protein n=1 Tax=Portunus trituberculatus TaxID=210409 RepID=A0A5B7KA02_PORTR|nr:hypothetical protein [Portunus trituberculatus]